MGGGYYDRDIIQSTNEYSNYSHDIFEETRRVVTPVTPKKTVFPSSPSFIEEKQPKAIVHKSVNPVRFKKSGLVCNEKNPIVFVIDVTDKLPLFFGQILLQGYLEEPSFCFAAVGDSYHDDVPFQGFFFCFYNKVCDFGQGKQIDQLISKIYLEGGGGGGKNESYELGAYFFQKQLKLPNSTLPFCFFTGDESFYDIVRTSHIDTHLDLTVGNNYKVESKYIFKLLKKKFKGNVFLLKKPFKSIFDEQQIMSDWKDAIGEDNIIKLTKPKAIIDVTLGIIAIVSRERSLEEYLEDMKKRGQTKKRIRIVRQALFNLSQKHVPKKQKERRKKVIEAKSYGIIPCRFKEDGKCEVCLAQHTEGGHFDFPKGLGEENEIGKQTAERELKEELNLSVVGYLSVKTYNTSYEITKWEGYKIKKTVDWFISEVSGEIKIQEKEISEVVWLPINEDGKEVIEKITFETGKNLVREVLTVLLEVQKKRISEKLEKNE